MARIARVEVVDDVDGRPIDSEDVHTVEFSVTLPGQRIARYVLDVRPANLAKFERDISKYTSRATKVAADNATAGGRVRASSTRSQAIRQWAHDNGYHVSARGRIPLHVVSAFDDTHA